MPEREFCITTAYSSKDQSRMNSQHKEEARQSLFFVVAFYGGIGRLRHTLIKRLYRMVSLDDDCAAPSGKQWLSSDCVCSYVAYM